MDAPLEMGQSVRIFTSPINGHQRKSTVEEDLSQMNKISCSVVISRPLCLLPFSLLSGLLNKMAMVAGKALIHVLPNKDFHQGQSGYNHC